MPKSLKKWLRSLEYKQEAVIVGLTLLALASSLCTLAMCFFNPDKAVLLLIVSLLFIATLLFYRTHHHIHLRASITTLRHVRAIRRKRKHRRTRTE